MSQILSAAGQYLVGNADRGRAALFDGTQAILYHETPQAAYQPVIDTGRITLEGWFFPSRIGPGYTVRQDLWNTTAGNGFSCYFWLAEYANWKPEFFWGGPQGQQYISGTPVTPRRWVHLAATYDRDAGPDNLRLYQDAQLTGTATAVGDLPFLTSNGIINPAGRCTLGGLSGDGARRFGGQVDEFRIWSVARTAQQIQDSMGQSIYFNNLGDRTGLGFALGCETIRPTPPATYSAHSPSAMEDSSGFGGHAFTDLNSELPARIGSLAPLPFKVLGLISV